MTNTPACTVVSIIFTPLYLILAILALIGVAQNKGRRRAFILLTIFGVCRAVGEILLIYAHYSKTTSTGVYQAGYILHGLGYSFLLSSALSFYQRVIPTPEGLTLRQKLMRLDNLVQYTILVALILVITGYNDSTALSDPAKLSGAMGGNGSGKIDLDNKVEIGNVIFMISTIGLGVLLLHTILQRSRGSYPGAQDETMQARAEAKVLLGTSACTIPFLLLRSIYTAIASLSSHPLGFNVASQAICSYLMDVVAASVLVVGGNFMVRRAIRNAGAPSSKDEEGAFTVSAPQYPPPASQYGAPTGLQSQSYPTTYPPSYNADRTPEADTEKGL